MAEERKLDDLTTLDQFLDGEGINEEVTASAQKRIEKLKENDNG